MYVTVVTERRGFLFINRFFCIPNKSFLTTTLPCRIDFKHIKWSLLRNKISIILMLQNPRKSENYFEKTPSLHRLFTTILLLASIMPFTIIATVTHMTSAMVFTPSTTDSTMKNRIIVSFLLSSGYFLLSSGELSIHMMELNNNAVHFIIFSTHHTNNITFAIYARSSAVPYYGSTNDNYLSFWLVLILSFEI